MNFSYSDNEESRSHCISSSPLPRSHLINAKPFGMTRKTVPITGRASSFLEKDLYALMLGFNNKIERESGGDRTITDLSIYRKVIALSI